MTRKHEDSSPTDPFRSLLDPEAKDFQRGLYDPFPVFSLPGRQINRSYESLAHCVQSEIPRGLRVLAIDGYHGVDWRAVRSNLEQQLAKLGVQSRWLDMAEALEPPETIDAHIEPFLGGNDRLFGMHYPLGIDRFLSPLRVQEYRIEASVKRGKAPSTLLVIFGCGAALVEQYDALWYADIPKDIIQERARNGGLAGFGARETVPFEAFYKRAYFIEWPALNRHKRECVRNIDLFMDVSSPGNPAWMMGDDFRAALFELSGSPFRVRPWFLPGPWGGKFMMGHMGLQTDRPNLAWSYELITPENGIVFESDGLRLECSFDCVMYLYHDRVLGVAARQFKYEWPIRLDYLDTVDGGNLSTQVHPRPDYVRRMFGETFTQDETYYITVAKPGARVYLGLAEGSDPAEFRLAVEESERNGTEIDIDRYVHSEPSKPHDLFLIPNGTVHCSGRGNLVLEISATPYIFTFKIYDYLRRDLNGGLRAINVGRAFDNIRFERRASWVRENLIVAPRLLRDGPGWKEYVLLDRKETFYNIHRLEFERECSLQTNGHAFAVNLVEGEWAEVVSHNGRATRLAFLESMVIPAATESFTVRNRGSRTCKLILVFVRPEIGRTQALNTPVE